MTAPRGKTPLEERLRRTIKYEEVHLHAYEREQIAPRVLTEALAAGGSEAKRAFDAMMDMTED